MLNRDQNKFKRLFFIEVCQLYLLLLVMHDLRLICDCDLRFFGVFLCFLFGFFLCLSQLCFSFQVIAAEGEMNASRALKEASEVISESPQALQLRYLQTLQTISAEKNSTIIFPLPIDMLSNVVSK